MRAAILVVWWVGLVGALIPTLVILKQAFLVVGTLRDILHLAEHTRTAARGIAANVAPVNALGALGDYVRPIPEALTAVSTPLRSVAQQLHAALGE
jgi:hypothetical protein